ncbi:hypothetical protein QX776_00135 [Alteromonadaceae bacterium BrNp21-10]|nr:hypothetical protein [Alteromonadaceae bacterium BrNp21-10]
MKPTFDSKYQNRFGRYHIDYHDKTLFLQLQGACQPHLVEQIQSALYSIINESSDRIWGCVIDLRQFEALTADAMPMLLPIFRYCLNNGCVIDTYLFNNAVAKSQFHQIRQSLGIRADITNNTFDNLHKAKRRVQLVVQAVKEKNAFVTDD